MAGDDVPSEPEVGDFANTILRDEHIARCQIAVDDLRTEPLAATDVMMSPFGRTVSLIPHTLVGTTWYSGGQL